jgi:hypothetical protein
LAAFGRALSGAFSWRKHSFPIWPHLAAHSLARFRGESTRFRFGRMLAGSLQFLLGTISLPNRELWKQGEEMLEGLSIHNEASFPMT